MNKLDTIRRGLVIADDFCGNHTADECPDTIAIPIKEALAAIDALKHAPSEDAITVVVDIIHALESDACTNINCEMHKQYLLDACSIITARDAATEKRVREECIKVAKKHSTEWLTTVSNDYDGDTPIWACDLAATQRKERVVILGHE
jgi:hypothetical protein